jgi:hypothetical protein
MILTAHQPAYLPWLGLLHKIALADLFCFFDIVQYQRKDFNNRNKINTANGPIWLTVPVESKDRFNSVINDIKIINNGWEKKHLRSIELNYKKTKYFNVYMPKLSEIILDENKYLSDLNYKILLYLLEVFNIDTKIVKASNFKLNGVKTDLVLDMCKQLKADKYIFGEQGNSYADVDAFNKAGVDVYFQKYKHPVYNQVGRDFVPYMSAIDLLFNEGLDGYDILMSGNTTRLELER